MPNKNKLRNLEKKRIELIQAIQLCDYNKNKTIRFVQDIKKQYSRGLLTYEKYYSELNKALKQKTPEQWIKYYDDYAYYYNNQLTVCEKEIGKERNGINFAPLLITLFILALLGFGLFFLRPTVTGFAIAEQNTTAQAPQEIPKEMIMRNYSTEQIVIGNRGTITDYHELKYPIFNGTDYLSWEEGVDYQKTADGIKIKTADGIECTAKWSLDEENITSPNTETVALSELINKKLKHDKLKNLRVSYQKEINETVEECNTIKKEDCENCTQEEICQNITNAVIITEYIDSSRLSIDMDKGEISLTDSLTENVTDVSIEYRYYDKSKDIPLTKKDISTSKNKLNMNKGLLSDLQCSTNYTSAKSVEHVSGDIYKFGHYYIDLDPSFYDDSNADWVLGTFSNTTNQANGNISLTRDFVNPVYTGSYTNSDGVGSIDEASSVYVIQQNGDTFAYVTSYIDAYLTVVNVSDPTAPVALGNGYTSFARPGLVDRASSVSVIQHSYNGDYYAYVTSLNNASLTVLNVSNPSSITYLSENISSGVTGRFLLSTNAFTIPQYGGIYAFVTDSTAAASNLIKFNVSDPLAPINVTNFADQAGAGSIDNVQDIFVMNKVQGPGTATHVYATSYADDYFTIVNATLPATMAVLGSVTNATTIDGAIGVYALQHTNGEYFAYVTGNISDRVTIYNVSNPAVEPMWMGSFNNSVGDGTIGGTSKVSAAQFSGDNFVYLTNSQDATFTIVNATIPTAPVMVARYNSSVGTGSIDGPSGLFIYGDYAYVTSNVDDYLTILNVNPYTLEGNYTSQIFNAAATVDWESVVWSETEDIGTNLGLAFRSCDDPACDTETFSTYESNGSSSLVGINNNQYFQYIANFTTTDASHSPLLDWVNITYSSLANTVPNNPTDVLLNSSIITQMNYTNESLSANFLCDDPDTSDTLTYLVEWWKNGANQTALFETASCSDPEYKSTTLHFGNTTDNEIWAFNVTVCDVGGLCSSQISSNSLTINNYPASTPDLNEPENNTNFVNVFTLELNWSNVSELDIDGDSYTYYLEVWNESSLSNLMYANISVNETINTTGSWVTFPSEENDYFWRVLANDGAVNSSWSELRNISFSITPANVAPSDPTLLIINSTATTQTNLTDEDLSANFLCDDTDTGDTLTYDITFYVNGALNFSELGVSCGAEPAYINHILKNENTTKGENWSFGVNVTDIGGLNSNNIFSDNITVENSNPTIPFVSLNDTLAPLDGGIRRFEFSFIANDTDGLTDLDDTKAIANISLSTENYLNTSCNAETNIALGRNYSCTIEMQYYFASGSWNYATEIKDNNAIAIQNSTLNGESQLWYYSQLAALNISASSLTWNTLIPGTINQTSTSNPIVVENTGNKPTLEIKASAVDLGGTGGRYIPAANFTIGNLTSAAKFECDFTNKTAAVTPGTKPLIFINATTIYPITAALPRAQGSKENLYYCLFDVPANLISEAYSTGTGTEWDISVE